MTKNDVIKAISVAVPDSQKDDRLDIAETYLYKAISRLGRMRDVSFNRDIVTFNTVANQRDYNIGVDILTDFDGVWNLYELQRTNKDFEIDLVGLDMFNDYATSTTDTGEPVIATIHSSNSILRFFPIPDAAYEIEVNVRKQITNFEDIPDAYHDVLIDLGIESLKAISDPNMAAKIAREGMEDVRADSQTTWDGSHIPLARHLAENTSSVKRVDSMNLRP